MAMEMQETILIVVVDLYGILELKLKTFFKGFDLFINNKKSK